MAERKKAALITGGASGIGLALTQHLLAKGWKVVVLDIVGERAEKVASELGPDVLPVQADIANWESSAAAFKKAFEWAGQIDFFAANAGVSEDESLYALADVDEPTKPSLSTIEVDLFSTFYGLKLYRHYVRKSGATGGKVVATASQAGFYPFPVAPIYAAAKHGVSSDQNPEKSSC